MGSEESNHHPFSVLCAFRTCWQISLLLMLRLDSRSCDVFIRARFESCNCVPCSDKQRLV